MIVVLRPKAGSLAFTPPGDEMSEVVSRVVPGSIFLPGTEYRVLRLFFTGYLTN